MSVLGGAHISQHYIGSLRRRLAAVGYHPQKRALGVHIPLRAVYGSYLANDNRPEAGDPRQARNRESRSLPDAKELLFGRSPQRMTPQTRPPSRAARRVAPDSDARNLIRSQSTLKAGLSASKTATEPPGTREFSRWVRPQAV
jgi:hypothetical protein